MGSGMMSEMMSGMICDGLAEISDGEEESESYVANFLA